MLERIPYNFVPFLIEKNKKYISCKSFNVLISLQTEFLGQPPKLIDLTLLQKHKAIEAPHMFSTIAMLCVHRVEA